MFCAFHRLNLLCELLILRGAGANDIIMFHEINLLLISFLVTGCLLLNVKKIQITCMHLMLCCILAI